MKKSADEIRIQEMIGARIKQLRQAAGLRTLDLAGQADISQGQLSKIETGKATLSISTLTRLCKVLKHPLLRLFQSEDEAPRILGTMTTVSTPASQAMDWFASEVRLRTNGRMSLLRLRGTQLGTPAEQVQQLQQGVSDLFMGELSYYHRFAPAVNMMLFPYTFRNEDHQTLFLQSEYCQKAIKEPLLAQGIRFLDRRWNWRWGLECVLVANRPIISPHEVRGLKVRVSDSPVEAGIWEGLGAEPIVVPWIQITSAWSRGRFDVLPACKAHLFPLGFCRFGRYVTLLGDVYPNLAVAASEVKYSALPPDIQQILKEACEDAGDYFSATVRQAEEENETLNLARYNAVYLKVDLTPWRTEAARIRQKMIDSGQLPGEGWAEVEKLATEHQAHPQGSFVTEFPTGGYTRRHGAEWEADRLADRARSR